MFRVSHTIEVTNPLTFYHVIYLQFAEMGMDRFTSCEGDWGEGPGSVRVLISDKMYKMIGSIL